MANVGDKVRVIRGIQEALPLGFETKIEDISRDGEVFRVSNALGRLAWCRAFRFEVIEAVEGAAPLEVVPRPFKAGDIVRIVKAVNLPGVGWSEPMDGYVLDGLEYEVAWAADHGHGEVLSLVDGGGWTWPAKSLELVRAAGEEAPGPVAIMPRAAPAKPAYKTGVVKPEDVEPGLRMVFKGPRRAPYPPTELVGKVFVIDAAYPGIRDAAYVCSENPEDGVFRFATFLENFDHLEPKKEIEVGSIVIAVGDYRNAAGVLRLEGGTEYTVKSVGATVSVHGVPGLYARRRFVLKEYYKAPEKELPNDPISFEEVKVGQYAKVVGWCGVDDAHDGKINDGKFYKISSKDADDQTVCLGDRYDGFQLPSVSCEFYARKGQELAPKQRQEKPSLRERFNLKQGGIHHGGLVSFAYRRPDGEEVINLSYVCYAPTRHAPIEELYIGARPMLEQVKTQAKDAVDNFKRYADYIMNHSPYAPSFITKDFDEGVENGLEMDTSKTKSQCIAAAVALRQGHEYYENIPTFIHFLDKGYSGDVAFLMHSVVRRDGKDDWSKTKMGDNHQCLTTKGSKKLLLEAFANGFAKGDEGPCRNGGVYNLFGVIQPGYSTYGHNRIADPFEDWAWGKLDTKEVGQGWGKKTIIKEESVYALADAITNELKELKK